MGDTVSEELTPYPEYFRFIRPVIAVQKELGGSGKPSKVRDLVLDRLGKSNKTSPPSATPCQSKIINEMQKVRQVLLHAGLLESSHKGVWTLTEKGLATDLSDIDLCGLNSVRKQRDRAYREKRKQKILGITPQSKERRLPPSERRAWLLGRIQTLPPAVLEKICQEVLSRSGFERLKFQGQNVERLIEGECLYIENALLRFNVLFWFKGERGSISEGDIKHFRRSIASRADKGIFMTIGYFTEKAKREAQTDGVAPILLVDGHKLLGMLENLKIRLETA